MRTFPSLVAALLAAASLASQSPLTTSFLSDDAGPVGGCVYFDLTVTTPITIDSLDLDSWSAVGTAGTLNVWVGPETWVGKCTDPSLWSLVASGAVVAAGVDAPSPCVLNTPFTLGPGTWSIALEHQGIAPAFSVGDGTNEIVSTAEVSLHAGAATALPFAGTPLTPRVWNGSLNYTLGGTPLPIAISSVYGAGCNARQTSFCECFAEVPWVSTFDLSNSTLRLQPNAQGGYDVTRTAGAAIVPPALPRLPLGDDAVSIEYAPFQFPFPGGHTNNIYVCSNGYIGFEPMHAADFSPTDSEMVAQGVRLMPAWMDFNPGAPGSGGIHYEIDPSNTFVTITWNNVWQYGFNGSSVSRFQVVLRDSGAIEIRYGTVRNYGAPCVVGFTTGNGNLGMPATEGDLTTMLPLHTAYRRGLGLAVPQRPLLGATLSLRTDDIPANALISTNLLSYTQYSLGIDLTANGAPGCSQYAGADAAELLFGFGSQTRLLGPLPLDPIWMGLEIFSQSASLVPGSNALNVITSNGVKLRVGGV